MIGDYNSGEVKQKDLPFSKSLIDLWSLDYKVTEQYIYTRVTARTG